MMPDELERVRIRSMEEFGLGPGIMKKLKKCSKCGEASPAAHEFCRECGTRLPKTTIYDFYRSLHRTCRHCDTVVSDGAIFCPQCGRKLEEYIPRREL